MYPHLFIYALFNDVQTVALNGDCEIMIGNRSFACGSVWVRNLVSDIKGGT
jgi:hypothetical protein